MVDDHRVGGRKRLLRCTKPSPPDRVETPNEVSGNSGAAHNALCEPLGPARERGKGGCGPRADHSGTVSPAHNHHRGRTSLKGKSPIDRVPNLPGQNTFNHPPSLGPPRAEQHQVATAQIRSRAERPGGASADDALSCLCASESSVSGGTTSSRSCRPEAMLRTI